MIRPIVAGAWFLCLACSAGLCQQPASLSVVVAQPLSAQKITVSGRVLAVNTARVGPRISAHLLALARTEDGLALDVGMPVKAGQPLFFLDPTSYQNALAVAQAAVLSAKANLANVRAKTRPERLEQLRQSVAELDARLADQQKEVDRYRRLVEIDKTLPPRRLEEAQTQFSVLKALHAAARARLEEAENGATATEIAVAEAAVKQAEATLRLAEDDLRDTRVVAPFDGMITRRFKSPGDYLTNVPPTEVLEIVSLDNLEAELQLPEAYFRSVQNGKTSVQLNSPLLGNPLTAPISRIVHEIDPATGMFAVRVAIPPQGRSRLVPGAFLTAEVAVRDESAGVVVPARAVHRRDGKTVVYVAERGRMVSRDVVLGDQLTDAVVVKSGLIGGEKVIVGSQDSLAPGKELPKELRDPA